MKTNKAKTNAYLKEMKANQQEVTAKMDTWIEGMEACVGKLEANREMLDTIAELQEVAK
jgi:hypothetical protein